MSQQPPPGSGKAPSSDLATTVAGGSLGTFLATLTQLLIHAEPLKSILIIASPGLAIVISTGGAWLRRRVIRMNNEREARAALAVAEATLSKRIRDQRLTKEQREQARQELEELRDLNVQTTLDYARAKIRKRYDES